MAASRMRWMCLSQPELSRPDRKPDTVCFGEIEAGEDSNTHVQCITRT